MCIEDNQKYNNKDILFSQTSINLYSLTNWLFLSRASYLNQQSNLLYY